ncbi:MAG: hypothetical protein HY512_01465 [Candidatus Aenigmarchaeota archaeon]|nr:hypothetical protein [Candidatus Aenigmarchaeota archaeon]
MKKVFVAAPFTENFENDFLLKIESVLKQLNFDPIVPHKFVVDDGDGVKESVARDFDLLDKSDILLAEVSKPSHGVGMEIMYAHQKGKKIIFVKKKGTRVSSMAIMHAHEIIEYENQDDLEKKLLKIGIE